MKVRWRAIAWFLLVVLLAGTLCGEIAIAVLHLVVVLMKSSLPKGM